MKKLHKLSKSGFTLLEVIISMTIMAIIAIAVSAFIVPSLRIYSETTMAAELNSLIDNISDEVASSLSNSTSVPKIEDTTLTVYTNNTSIAYSNGTGVNEGVLVKEYDAVAGTVGQVFEVLPRNYYKNKEIEFIPTEIRVTPTEYIYNLRFTLTDGDGRELLSKEVVSRPLIINQYN